MHIDKMKKILILSVTILNMLHEVLLAESPCPNVFDYEELQPNEDRWYGAIYLTTKSSLVGVRLDIRFDRPVILIVSWMGEVTSKNNKKFTILSLNEKLLPGPPLLSRFMVKFDRRNGIPELTTIRLNGRKICPPDPDFAIEPVNENEGSIIERPVKEVSNTNHGGSAINSGSTFSNSGSSNKTYSYNDRTSTTSRYLGDNSYTTRAIRTTTERYIINNSRPIHNQSPSQSSGEHKPSSTVRTTTERGSRPAHKEDTLQMSFANNKKPLSQGSNNHSSSHANSGEYIGISTNNQNKKNQNTHTILHNVNTNSSKTTSNSNKQTKPFGSSSIGENWETHTQSTVKRTTLDTSSLQNVNNRPEGSWESNTKFTQTQTSHNKPTNQRPFLDQDPTISISTECGLVDDQVATLLQSAPVPLITNGRQTTQGQWPWHIALYRTTGPESNYICGGTLITSNVVLTAAHCVYNKYDGRPVDPTNLVIYLGKYHLNQYSDDSGVQLKQVREMRVHPDYSSVSYAADIAILILTSPTEYTTFVRPCCLWRSPLQSVEGKTGTVVGWGFDENKQVSQELKMAEMPVVSQRICIESYREFFERYASNRTYCAGSRTGVSACNGDSGGGMVFSLGSRWYLRGIVSIAVPKDNKICDPNHFIIFTDVAKYISWINDNIQ